MNILQFKIGNKTFYLGQEVAIYIGDEIFEQGFVTFGMFNAEIYEVYGLFVADKNGKQVSEAGLNDDFESIRKTIEIKLP